MLRWITRGESQVRNQPIRSSKGCAEAGRQGSFRPTGEQQAGNAHPKHTNQKQTSLSALMTSSLKQSLWFRSVLSVYKEGHVAMVTDAGNNCCRPTCSICCSSHGSDTNNGTVILAVP